jgi:hypothetical protein
VPRSRKPIETTEGTMRRLAGSKKGAEEIRQAFADVITRRVFSERVGIHLSTVRRWESMGVVEPILREVRGIPTMVFSEDDVSFGLKVVRLLKANPGTISLTEAAESVAGCKGRTGRTGRSR